MASTNFTTHYSIPLPLGTDLTTPMDYNEAAEAVDTALFGAVTDAGNAALAAGEAVNTANAASGIAEDVRADLALEKGKIIQLQTRMTAAENDIDDVYTDVTDMITAYKEPSATSTHAYAIGDYFIYNETLYKATAAIAIGATIVPNTNCETTNVASELIQINSDLSDVTDELTGASTELVLATGFGGSAIKIEMGNLVVVSFSTYNNDLAINAGDSYEILNIGSPCAHTRNIVGAINGTIVVCSVTSEGKVTIVPRGGNIPAGTFISGEIVTLKI